MRGAPGNRRPYRDGLILSVARPRLILITPSWAAHLGKRLDQILRAILLLVAAFAATILLALLYVLLELLFDSQKQTVHRLQDVFSVVSTVSGLMLLVVAFGYCASGFWKITSREPGRIAAPGTSLMRWARIAAPLAIVFFFAGAHTPAPALEPVFRYAAWICFAVVIVALGHRGYRVGRLLAEPLLQFSSVLVAVGLIAVLAERSIRTLDPSASSAVGIDDWAAFRGIVGLASVGLFDLFRRRFRIAASQTVGSGTPEPAAGTRTTFIA